MSFFLTSLSRLKSTKANLSVENIMVVIEDRESKNITKTNPIFFLRTESPRKENEHRRATEVPGERKHLLPISKTVRNGTSSYTMNDTNGDIGGIENDDGVVTSRSAYVSVAGQDPQPPFNATGDGDGVFVRDEEGDRGVGNINNYDDDESEDHQERRRRRSARRTLINFISMAILFSANHGCVVSCLGLASARLGSVGAWQSGILYFTYTASALLGATYIVKRAGARNALLFGMVLYCAYVACFWVATLHSADPDIERLAAYTGAAIGGVGAGFLWTAQGAYFSLAAEDHAKSLSQPISTSTASLAGIFAFFYLSEEVALRLLSTALLEWNVANWGTIFATYTIVAMLSTSLMPFLHNYPSADESSSIHNDLEEPSGVNRTDSDTYNDDGSNHEQQPYPTRSTTTRMKSDIFYKVTAAAQLLFADPKMKYLIGLNAAFGFASSFMNSYVNGQVVPIALNDPDSKYVGILGSWVPTVAAAMSLLFGRIAPRTGKGPILILGATCFGCVALPFAIQPDATKYTWISLIVIYTLHGTGRATFESTLKALFADYFPFEKEGAFANIIFQNGLSGAVGYILTFSLHCSSPARYCIEYNDGSLHDVLTFVVIVLLAAALAIVGYIRASTIFAGQQLLAARQEVDSTVLLE